MIEKLYERKDWKHASASQLKTFSRCEMMWAWMYMYGLKMRERPALALGTECHEGLERYAIHNDPDDLNEITKGIVGSGLLPDLPLKLENIERAVRIETDIVPIVGKIDLDIPYWRMVIDHKTSSDIGRYALTSEDLIFDFQSRVYLFDAVERWGGDGDVAFRHIYYQTKGARRIKPVECWQSPDEVRTGFDKHVLPVLANMKRTTEMEMMEIPVNTAACGDYGGCDFRTHCARAGKFENVARKEGEKFMDQFWAMQSKEQEVKEETKEQEVKEEELSCAGLNPPDAPESPAEPEPEPIEKVAKIAKATVRKLKKDELVATWKYMYPRKKDAAVGWDGEAKSTRKMVLDDVCLMIDAGVELPQEPVEEPTLEPVAEPVAEAGFHRDYMTPTLFIDCLPHNETVIFQDQVIQPLADLFFKKEGVHYTLPAYNEGLKMVASALKAEIEHGRLPLPTKLFVSKDSVMGRFLLDVLEPMYRANGRIIQGAK